MLRLFWLLLSWALSLGERVDPDPPPAPDTPGCFDACVQRKERHGESGERAEESCMQDCISGE
jgi:hypothetical protein